MIAEFELVAALVPVVVNESVGLVCTGSYKRLLCMTW